MRRVVVMLGASILVGGCWGGGGSNTTPTPPATTPPSEQTQGATRSPTQGALEFRAGPPISAAEAVGSIANMLEGRTLFPAGARGDEVLIESSVLVRPAPGEVVGQGPSRYDQVFLFWNPVTGATREIWSNQSDRNESVYAIDGDWAVTLLYRLNPGNAWTLRLRNVMTGEVRDIDEESEPRGLEYVEQPSIVGDLVVYAKSKRDGERIRSEVLLYDIGSAKMTTLDTSTATTAVGSASLAGTLASWVSQDSGGSTIAHLLEVTSGRSREVEVPGACRLTDAGRWFICDSGTSPSGGGAVGFRTLAVRVSDGAVVELSDFQGPFWTTWGAYGMSWPQANPGDTAELHDFQRMESRRLAANARQSGQLLQGWFTWVEWVDNADGSLGRTGTIHAMRLP